MSPHETRFDPDFTPGFKNVIVEMPQIEVMTKGYRKNIKAESFPVVQRFLHEKLSLPFGSFSFDDLVRASFAQKPEKWIQSNLYGWGGYGVTAGNINAGDAAYIHGTVRIGLMRGTIFIYADKLRRVEAEIGAGDDNWDFDLSSIPKIVNATVAAILGPDHYNHDAPIQIHFRGPGKRSIAEHHG